VNLQAVDGRQVTGTTNCPPGGRRARSDTVPIDTAALKRRVRRRPRKFHLSCGPPVTE
jgi:hypothetical protein